MSENQIVIASGIAIHSSSTATDGAASQRAGLPRALVGGGPRADERRRVSERKT